MTAAAPRSRGAHAARRRTCARRAAPPGHRGAPARSRPGSARSPSRPGRSRCWPPPPRPPPGRRSRGASPPPTRRRRRTPGSRPTRSTARRATARTSTTAPFAPPLRGTAFREAWLPRSVEALFTLTSTTMPEDRPGVLDDETVTELVALMLQENGVGGGRPGAAGRSRSAGGAGPRLELGRRRPLARRGAAAMARPVQSTRRHAARHRRGAARSPLPATGCCGAAPTRRTASAPSTGSTRRTWRTCASPGPGRSPADRTSRHQSSATACSSCTATATGCRRSTRRAATSCGSTSAGSRAASRRA